jgi:hypothetical protein
MKAHGEELAREAWDDLPDAVKELRPRVELEPEVDYIERWLVFTKTEGAEQYLKLADLTIFELEERFPDCDIGW